MHLKESEDFEMLIGHARDHFDKKLPFVIYRNPNEDKVIGIFQDSDRLNTLSDYTEEGFVLAPFDSEKSPVLLKEDHRIVSTFAVVDATQAVEILRDDSGKASHLELVSNAINTIHSSDLRKVVLSRKVRTKTKKDAFTIFSLALSKYPGAFCYLWYHPKVGQWMGATPERLLHIKGHQLSTVSLAGTIKSKQGQLPNWGHKEKEEHQMVTDYLIERFSKKLKSVQVSQVASVKAGNLWHLKATVNGLATPDFIMGDLIRDIHPTPAVCGLPKEMAYDFIRKAEAYDREFYTGFLGEINSAETKETSLYVNLRCLKFEGGEVSIFVGGGLTAESIAADEWEETQHKCQTMMALL